MTHSPARRRWLRIAASAAMASCGPLAASDHLDAPTVLADPAADIGDLYAWTSTDGRRLNVALDIVGRRFSDQVRYVIHVDSGPAYGHTTASVRMACQFDAAGVASCWAGSRDRLNGDAGQEDGLEGREHRFRVFAGLRDDPYFNNVRGTRAALDVAAQALRNDSAPRDGSGVPRFSEDTLKAVREQWRHTQGGPAVNFLAGWSTSAIVVTVDLAVVNAGGPLLAVWGRTERRQAGPEDDTCPPPPGAPIDRAGRALTGNALLGTFSDKAIADALKESYNRAEPAGWSAFTAEIAQNLAVYDGFDGQAGNQWLADPQVAAGRYARLARVLADDRLWVDSRRTTCREYLAVERAAFGVTDVAIAGDCGGRTPRHNVNGVFRSLLIRGTTDTVDDGLDLDDKATTAAFPFLAAP